MMNTIAPFWDGNETWLVLGGGGLLVAFPLAYSILMPALHVPILVMLLASRSDGSHRRILHCFGQFHWLPPPQLCSPMSR
jgi:hypothetical protein